MTFELRHSCGFTLVEMLVAVVITGILGTGIMSLYVNSSRTYETQTLVSEAQQNVRAGLDALAWDIRMAGYDPTRDAGAGFLQAGSDAIQVTMDLGDDSGAGAPDGDLTDASSAPDPEENITYSLYASGTDDVYGNPIVRLGRDTNSGGGNSPVAEYIEDIGFAYAFDSNNDGVLDSDAGGRTHWAVIGGNGNWWELDADGDDQITVADDTNGDNSVNSIDTGIAADLNDIRAVKVWLLARTPRRDRNPAPSEDYIVGDQIFQSADGMRRRLLTTSIICKNMGL